MESGKTDTRQGSRDVGFTVAGPQTAAHRRSRASAGGEHRTPMTGQWHGARPGTIGPDGGRGQPKKNAPGMGGGTESTAAVTAAVTGGACGGRTLISGQWKGARPASSRVTVGGRGRQRELLKGLVGERCPRRQSRGGNVGGGQSGCATSGFPPIKV